MKYKPLPVGIDRFDELILGGYYYVDKTWFIKELLDLKGEVNLFTRPRGFGKTLNIACSSTILKIQVKMNALPVINLSLKSGKQPLL